MKVDDRRRSYCSTLTAMAAAALRVMGTASLELSSNRFSGSISTELMCLQNRKISIDGGCVPSCPFSADNWVSSKNLKSYNGKSLSMLYLCFCSKFVILMIGVQWLRYVDSLPAQTYPPSFRSGSVDKIHAVTHGPVSTAVLLVT